jgi:hypothetical protein
VEKLGGAVQTGPYEFSMMTLKVYFALVFVASLTHILTFMVVAEDLGATFIYV